MDIERRSAESPVSAVSWGAVLAGAFVAAALSLILLSLGSGLGLSSVSPWESAGATAKTIGIATAVWLAVMQIIASGTGGYMAGRLRTRWVDVHTNEVFFRDTAHGFLAWAVATVATAALLTSAASSLAGAGAKAGTAVLGAGAASGLASAQSSPAANGDTRSSALLVDRLLRTDRAPTEGSSSAAAGAPPAADDGRVHAELARMFRTGTTTELAPADRAYVTQVIVARTGIPQADAEKRIDAALAQANRAADEARETADQARKAAAWLSLWVFISLLIGAFTASYAATLGGRLRDQATL